MIHMLEDECLHSFLLELPNVDESVFNPLSVLEEAKRNNSSYDNDVMLYMKLYISGERKTV